MRKSIAHTWQEEVDNPITEINELLQKKYGKEFSIRICFDNVLAEFSEAQLTELANCYKTVFNESWGESWTTESALEEVKDSLTWRMHRIPIAAFLYKENKIVGFAWGLLLDSEHLIAERDMPFDLPVEKKYEGLKVVQYWLDMIVRKKNYYCCVN